MRTRALRSPVPLARELDPEAAPLPGLRLQARSPAHLLGRLPDDREANPRAGVLLDGVEAFEDPENALSVLRGDADPAVLHPEPDVPPRPVHAHLDPGLLAVTNELQGVRKEISECLRGELAAPH